MKHIYTFLILSLLSILVQAQAPQQFKYQAALRDSEGNILSNQNATIVVDILQGSTDGTSIFTESHTVTTQSNGLINLSIGSVNSLDGINWSSNCYFLQIRINDEILGVSQLLSVPYAIHSKTAENITGNINESQITDLQSYLTSIENQSIASLLDVDLTGIANNDVLKYDADLSKFVVAEAFGTTETDPVFSAWDKSTGISITESQINDLQAYITSENDPLFESSAANNITNAGSGLVITAAERNKLSNIEDGANVNIQADWNQTTTSSDDFIKNKPTAISNFSLDANAQNITNLADPVNEQDAATKAYTENLITNLNTDDADADPTNELQDLSLDGTNLLISNGTGVDLSGISGGGSQTLEDVLTNGNSAGTNRITNLAPPQEIMDAVTKGYVDALEDRITTLELLLGVATLSDVDGNNYEYVQIGTQIWMAENLKVTHYADGTPIDLVTNGTTWSNLSETDKAYCFYSNNEGTSYGALYTWAAATNGESSSQNPSNVQGVCPDGWHLPSDAEWAQLRDYIGITGAGGKLKETGTAHWTSPNTGATDEYNFTGLPNGQRLDNGTFESKGTYGYFWTSKQSSSGIGSGVYLVYNSGSMLWSSTSKEIGRSVRCVKD